MILDDFIAWHTKIAPEIQDVMSLMGTKLDKEPEGLINDLMVIETWNCRFGELLAEANGFLDRAKGELMPDKEMGTEMVRKASLDAQVAPLRVVRDKLESICDCIKQRLIMGESILSFHKQFPDRKPREALAPF